MIIEVIHRVNFGHNRFYPSNKNAKVLLELMGRETLTHEQLKTCKANGWQVEIKTEAFNL